LIKSQVLYHLS